MTRGQSSEFYAVTVEAGGGGRRLSIYHACVWPLLHHLYRSETFKWKCPEAGLQVRVSVCSCAKPDRFCPGGHHLRRHLQRKKHAVVNLVAARKWTFSTSEIPQSHRIAISCVSLRIEISDGSFTSTSPNSEPLTSQTGGT
ncbi:hypothetical protein EVAR_66884_1 [Eumeta japonica]|uniref:Uncharacterized protein n=1 Tax=Eumeta variegata TaxID=151549 RepID=A0A4C1ZSY0_EUMVA|nr:hypothetical protein EVAR_66884_1 [Eumeta japonica]